MLDGAVSRNDTEAPTANNIEITNITENSFTVNLNIIETNSGIKTEDEAGNTKTYTDTTPGVRIPDDSFG